MCRKESELETSSVDSAIKKPPPNMLDLTANIEPTEIFAELRVSGFDLIICLDFLLKISYFFSAPGDNTLKRDSRRPIEKPLEKPIDKSAEKKVVAKSEQEPEKKMKIILHVEEPDIILVESLEDMDTNAIILNMKSNLVYRTSGEKQIMTGEISDLKMYMCSFKPDRREQTKHYVIYPCVITLHESLPEDQGMHISLTFSDIIINISPATTELFTKALSTVSSKGDETVVEIKEVVDYSNIWAAESFQDKKYWFLKCEKAQDALELLESPTTAEKVVKTEKCVIELPSIIVVFETGFGYYTSPMFNIEFEIHTTISNWSSKLSVDGDLSFTMQYYNAKLATWEPMIEPNEHIKPNGLSEFDTWTIEYSIQMNQKKESDDGEESLEADRKISITSNERLEVTISKTCLDLLGELGNAFSEAVYSKGLSKPKIVAPYEIVNETGFELSLDFTKGVFTLHDCHTPGTAKEAEFNTNIVLPEGSSQVTAVTDIKSCIVPHGSRAYLQTKIVRDVVDSVYNDTIVVKISNLNKELILPVKKTDQRYFPLNRDTNNDPWGIVSEVTTLYGTTTIKVRSVLNIHNHFTSTVSVYRNHSGARLLIGEIQPRSVFNVPLHSVYTDSKELYFSLPGYKASAQGFKWNDSPSDLNYSKSIQCDPINTFESLFINARREKTEIFHENTSKYTILSAYYTIHLRPPLYLRNALPIELYISVSGCSAKKGCEYCVFKNISLLFYLLFI